MTRRLHSESRQYYEIHKFGVWAESESSADAALRPGLLGLGCFEVTLVMICRVRQPRRPQACDYHDDDTIMIIICDSDTGSYDATESRYYDICYDTIMMITML